jgi:hypothetical protein
MNDDLSGWYPAINWLLPQTGLALSTGQHKARLFLLPAAITHGEYG